MSLRAEALGISTGADRTIGLTLEMRFLARRPVYHILPAEYSSVLSPASCGNRASGTRHVDTCIVRSTSCTEVAFSTRRMARSAQTDDSRTILHDRYDHSCNIGDVFPCSSICAASSSKSEDGYWSTSTLDYREGLTNGPHTASDSEALLRRHARFPAPSLKQW